mgnify:FL=1|tara:strand:+ start:4954 stop:6159 length:1206 start_codon:yes stop_codon:yes gene_type:complete
MGFLSKLKDKVTKTLRKVTPKEVAPFLPLAAMVLPGSGILASSMSKLLVPQLLAAAGSSRTSGEINPLNQIMAGLGSMSAINAANTAAATTAGATPNIANVGSPGAMASQQAAQQAAAKQIANPGFLDKAAASMSNVPGLGRGMEIMGQGQKDILSLLPGGDPATFSKSMLAPAGAGLGMFTMDAAKAAQKEYEDEQAAAAAVNAAYGDARSDLAAAIARFSDPINRYGNNPYGNFNPVTGQLLNQGGRVKYNMGSNEQGVQSQGIPSAFDDPSDYAEFLIDPEAYRIKKYLEMSDNEPIIMGPEDYNMGRANGGRIGMNMGGGLGSIPQTSMVPQGMQVDGRGGGFIPMGAQERRDDVPAMLAKNEFVMTADAVRAAGGGSVEKGAQKMYDVMNQLEAQV